MKIYFIFFLSFYVSLGAGFQMIPHSNSKIIEIKKLVQPSLRRHSLGNTGLFASRIGGTSVQSWTRFKYNWIANQLSDVSSYIQSKFSPPILLVIALLSFGLLSQSGNILASGKKVTQAQINIDLYGRVPFDDFLFTTARLTDPDLLKRSLPEAIFDEMANTRHSFSRRMKLFEIRKIASGFVVLGIFAGCMSTLYRSSRARAALNRYGMPISAVQKGSRRNRKYEGDGVYAMNEFEDDPKP